MDHKNLFWEIYEMAKKIRKTQEEEILQVLAREGFQELTEKDLEKEPYKSIYALPDCFSKDKEATAESSEVSDLTGEVSGC